MARDEGQAMSNAPDAVERAWADFAAQCSLNPGLRKKKAAPRKRTLPAVPEPIVFTRADPAALARFDPRTKVCTMNCGPHRDDPRSNVERQFLCGDCQTL